MPRSLAPALLVELDLGPVGHLKRGAVIWNIAHGEDSVACVYDACESSYSALNDDELLLNVELATRIATALLGAACAVQLSWTN